MEIRQIGMNPEAMSNLLNTTYQKDQVEMLADANENLAYGDLLRDMEELEHSPVIRRLKGAESGGDAHAADKDWELLRRYWLMEQELHQKMIHLMYMKGGATVLTLLTGYDWQGKIHPGEPPEIDDPALREAGWGKQ